MRFLHTMRRAVLALAACAFVAALPRGAAAQEEERPDLTGSWKLQQPDSVAPVGRTPPGGGPQGGNGTIRRPGGGRDTLSPVPARTLVIAQSDSTVTIGGERFPQHTYFTDGREESLSFGGVDTVVRAWWEWGDLVIERKGGERTTTESYRLDAKGPWLFVIVEIRPDAESDEPLRAIRLHRIYQPEGPPPAR
jgi:hypothetical protein